VLVVHRSAKGFFEKKTGEQAEDFGED